MESDPEALTDDTAGKRPGTVIRGDWDDVSGPPGWDLSCLDWKVRLRERRSLIPDLPLDRQRADQALAIFKKLRIPNVPGQPSYGEAAAPETLRFVEAIFGGYDVATQQRMIRGYFKLVSKKNGKTTDAGAIALTGAILNKRPQAELIFTSESHVISLRGYNHAKGMIALDREGYLQRRFHVRDHEQTIVDRVTGSELKVHTFSPSIVTGAVPAMVIIDEVHLLGRVARAAAIIQQLTGGMVSVPEAFWAMITTQSTEPPAGVFKANLQLARKIRDGEVRDVDTLPVLYELPEELQKDRSYWEDPKNWGQLQPNLGRSTFIPRLVKDLAEVRRKGEDETRIWFSQHLNIEMGLGFHSDAWAGTEYWEGTVDRSITSLADLIARCEVIDFGIDGGGLDDLLGLTAVGRDRRTKQILSWSKGWAHRIVLKRRQDIAPRLLDFEKAGELVLVDKLETAYAQAAALVYQAYVAGLIDRICVDRAGVAGIVTAIKKKLKLTDEQAFELIEGVHQGWQLSGSIKDTESALSDGRMLHADQAVMTWCIGNCKQTANGNAVSITKQNSGTAKIDLAIALFIAMSRMRLDPTPAATRSIYDDEDAYDEAFGDADTTTDDAARWDPAILADARHPLFVEHKRRFERWQDLQAEE